MGGDFTSKMKPYQLPHLFLLDSVTVVFLFSFSLPTPYSLEEHFKHLKHDLVLRVYQLFIKAVPVNKYNQKVFNYHNQTRLTKIQTISYCLVWFSAELYLEISEFEHKCLK